MIPLRTLIIILLIVISLIFIFSFIFVLFGKEGKGISRIIFEFCKITIGKIPFIGDAVCEPLAIEV